MKTLFGWLVLMGCVGTGYFSKKQPAKKKRNWWLGLLSLLVIGLGACSPSDTSKTTPTSATKVETSTVATKTKDTNSSAKEKGLAQQKQESAQKLAEQEKAEKEAQEQAEKEAAEAKKQQQLLATQQSISQTDADLANWEYAGVQTVPVNNGIPTFSAEDLSTQNGAWETYGELDNLNRVTSANALLNKRLMPTEKRGDISNVQPTGWKNKKLGSGYLYNRSHLIGYALAGENANWKNLMTGTRQLNSPEMLRFEMDIKYYLEQSNDNYVRYSVTPVFRGDELLARGVHLMAQSVNSDTIKENVYIYNIQDGVTINYADGSSQTSEEQAEQQQAEQDAQPKTPALQSSEQSEAQPTSGEYVDASGNGLIKGSNSGIYHVPGSRYYNQTTNPAAWFKSVEEAQQAGYRAPKQ